MHFVQRGQNRIFFYFLLLRDFTILLFVNLKVKKCWPNLHKWRISRITYKAELDSSWVPETMPHTVTQLCLYNFIKANGQINTIISTFVPCGLSHIFPRTVNVVIVSKMLVHNSVIFPDRQAFSRSHLIWEK